MDVTRKIPEEDIKLLDDIQLGLRKRNIKISQKELINKAIKFSLKDNREDFIKMLKTKTLHKDASEKILWDRFLNSKTRIKGNFIKEHDSVL